jgi:tetratricopeptide (TPR) repeat protein
MDADTRIEQARSAYDRMAFAGDSSGLAGASRDLDGVEADLALARGRLLHGRFLEGGAEDPRELVLFERAAELYRGLGDVRGEGESLLWAGIFHQFVRKDNDAAVPALRRSRELIEQAGDRGLLSYVLRHLGIADHAAGRLDAARELLEKSTGLRRDLGLWPGVAANLVGLAYIAAAQGRRDEATAIVTEAAEIAQASGAHAIARQVEEARAAAG